MPADTADPDKKNRTTARLAVPKANAPNTDASERSRFVPQVAAFIRPILSQGDSHATIIRHPQRKEKNSSVTTF
jgi:hypothetical protein